MKEEILEMYVSLDEANQELVTWMIDRLLELQSERPQPFDSQG